MVTIADVARHAGVSPMTVSNVLNDRSVRDTTRQRVVASMEVLGYRVNMAARSLRAGRTNTIGFAVAEIDRPYWGQLAARVIEEAARHHLRVLVEQTGAEREGELNALSMSRNRMYDGLILSNVGIGPEDADLLRVDYPVVILGERIFDGPVDHVAMANTEGARLAVRHLIQRGSRRIATLDQHADSDAANASSLRFAGYRQALKEKRVRFDERLACRLEDLSMESGYRATWDLVRSGVPFDGLFCVTDTVAMGALRALHEADLPVPQAVRVIGFDNIREGGFLRPSLSTVDPDHAAIAHLAVDTLVRRIRADGDDTTVERVEYTSPVRLVERESTA